MSGLWILILGGIMFMFVGGPVKEMAFAVGGAILFSGTYIPSYDKNRKASSRLKIWIGEFLKHH